MKRLIVILLLLTMLMLSGCEEAWEDTGQDSENQPELHFMYIPKPNGGVGMYPIYY